MDFPSIMVIKLNQLVQIGFSLVLEQQTINIASIATSCSLYEGILVHSQKNCFWMPTSQDLHALNVLML